MLNRKVWEKIRLPLTQLGIERQKVHEGKKDSEMSLHTSYLTSWPDTYLEGKFESWGDNTDLFDSFSSYSNAESRKGREFGSCLLPLVQTTTKIYPLLLPTLLTQRRKRLDLAWFCLLRFSLFSEKGYAVKHALSCFDLSDQWSAFPFCFHSVWWY